MTQEIFAILNWILSGFFAIFFTPILSPHLSKVPILDEIVFDNVDDLQKMFELYSNKDLSWFFSTYINLIEPLDYKISLKEKQISYFKEGFGGYLAMNYELVSC